MHKRGLLRSDEGFTLIELLVVIAIIAILAVVVVLVLNPAEMLRQSRDSNRLSDFANLNQAVSLYTSDQSGSSGFNIGSSSVVYLSAADPGATSTAGDQCQNLSLPQLPTGWSYHCSSSSTLRNVNGTGWLPINFGNMSSGSPFGNLPVDPTNQTSSGLYYSYVTSGTQFELTNILESQKYIGLMSSDGGSYDGLYQNGSLLGATPPFRSYGLTGYWPFDEGSGTASADKSGNKNSETSYGSPTWTAGKVGSYALSFNGTTQLGSMPSQASYAQLPMSIAFWFNAAQTPVSFGADMYLLQKEKSSSPFRSWQIYLSDTLWPNKIVFLPCNAAGSCTDNLISNNTITAGTWYFLVITMNASGTEQMYVNGTLQSGVDNEVGIQSSDAILDVAQAWSSNLFDGSLDDIRIYSRALTGIEIQTIYNFEK